MSERFTKDGELMITRQQRALLQAIWEVPDQRYRSITDWAWGAGKHIEGSSREGLRRCAGRMPEAWVSRSPQTWAKACRLEPRGCEIIEGRIPVWVMGVGRLGRGFAGRERSRASLRRLSLGRLLEWMEDIQRLAGDASDPDQAAHYRSRLVDGEIVLAQWKPRLPRPPRLRGRWGHYKIRGEVQRAVRVEDVTRFADVARMFGSLEWVAQQALSFSGPKRRTRALEEVALLAEARALGLFETRRRRLARRDQQEKELHRRLVDVLASERARREE